MSSSDIAKKIKKMESQLDKYRYGTAFERVQALLEKIEFYKNLQKALKNN